MCEITKYNFNQKFDNIVNDFRNAVFISIDCEFSALHVRNEFKGSLFDTPEIRYEKIRNNFEKIIPLEIGMTAFHFDRDAGIYTAKPYKFYIFPENFATIDKVFFCQASSFHFLGEHHFNFNKVIYDGITYLNDTQEKHLQEHINKGTLYNYCNFYYEDFNSEFIQKYTSICSGWFHSTRKQKEMTLFEITTQSYAQLFLLHTEIRQNFSENIWTFVENHQFKVKRVNPEEYKQLNKENPLEEKLLNDLLGFTRIYRQLIKLKKPLVGHNLLNDLFLMSNTFYNPSPKSYVNFKLKIHEQFPIIYDTKTLSFEMLHHLSSNKRWSGNSLKDIYEYFKNENGRHVAPGSPMIVIADDFDFYKQDKFHDAGWDSYCTGYCFVRMAHFFKVKDMEIYVKKIFMTTEYFRAIAQYENQINIIKATSAYLNFAGADPPSVRPPFLIIQSTNNKPVDIFKASVLLREFGLVDIRPHSLKGRRAIVAVANYSSVRRILNSNNYHKDFKIVIYNSLKHSPFVRVAIWSSVVASGGVLAWLFHKHFTNK